MIIPPRCWNHQPGAPIQGHEPGKDIEGREFSGPAEGSIPDGDTAPAEVLTSDGGARIFDLPTLLGGHQPGVSHSAQHRKDSASLQWQSMTMQPVTAGAGVRAVCGGQPLGASNLKIAEGEMVAVKTRRGGGGGQNFG